MTTASIEVYDAITGYPVDILESVNPLTVFTHFPSGKGEHTTETNLNKKFMEIHYYYLKSPWGVCNQISRNNVFINS